ncbi:MAG TPA: response regulator [Candidatus Angelobacter sp.]|jgi:CheY-like chemotaxis protein|nr:response regulator [Candidatus Angelobacter sp.]
MTEPVLPTILLVEDTPSDATLIRRAFEKTNVLNPIIWTKNGQEALGYLSGLGQYGDRAQYPLPALILLDLDLPEMTGFELLQWKRSQPNIRRIPAVVLTIDSASSAVNAAYDLGANSYLVKPGNPEEIMRVVKTIQEYWLGLNQAPKLVLRATPDAR